MRNQINNYRQHDPRINYRGASASRVDNLTDAVFGIAITLLIFTLANPNSYADLINFAKTLPAFLLSISFLLLIWYEHSRFSEVYSLNDTGLAVLNTFFIALVIFFVYPLRFLTLLLTNLLFETNIELSIQPDQIHHLMVYYGIAVFAIYFVLFLFYYRVGVIKKTLELNNFEVLYTKWQKIKLIILFTVPLISVCLTIVFSFYSHFLAALIGGMTYWLYTPAMLLWSGKFTQKTEGFEDIAETV